MKHALWLLTILCASFAHAGSPCGAVADARDDAAYWVLSQADQLVLYRCTPTDCNQRVGFLPRAAVLESLLDAITAEKRALDGISTCVEKRAVEEDDALNRRETLTDAELHAVHARHEETLAEVGALRARLAAMNEAVRAFKARWQARDIRISLTPASEPLWHRLVPQAFGVR